MSIDDLQILAHAIAWIAISFCLCLFGLQGYTKFKTKTDLKRNDEYMNEYKNLVKMMIDISFPPICRSTGIYLPLKIKKLHQSARMPEYATSGAACFDLYAATVNGYEHIGDIVYPGHPAKVGLGLAFEVPQGYKMEILPRSGLAFKHGVQAFAGTIDSDYRGEVVVLLECNYLGEDDPPFRINPGDRVAQACLVQVPRVTFEAVEELSETDRGAGGFGSTGA